MVECRHGGFKPLWPKGHAGSNPVARTVLLSFGYVIVIVKQKHFVEELEKKRRYANWLSGSPQKRLRGNPLRVRISPGALLKNVKIAVKKSQERQLDVNRVRLDLDKKLKLNGHLWKGCLTW